MSRPLPSLSEETRQRIEDGLRRWSDSNSEARKRFEAVQDEWDRLLQPLEDALIASEHLTEYDFGIRYTPLE